MHSEAEVKRRNVKIARSSDGGPVHPSHGTYHIVRLVVGSAIHGWTVMLAFMVLGFTGNIKFTESIDLAVQWLFIGGTVLGITVGIIFAIIAALIVNIVPPLRRTIHPLSLVRAAFVLFTVWPLLALIAWPHVTWGIYAAPIITLIASWLSIRSNPHSELFPHSTLGRALGSATGPFLLIALLLALIIPMHNRAIGPPHAPRLIFVAVDGVDETILTKMLADNDADRYPDIAALREEGAYGCVGASSPLIPSRLWASMLTGTTHENHQILDRNSQSSDLASLPLWEILALRNVRVGLFQMPPPHETASRSRFDIPPLGSIEATTDQRALALEEMRAIGRTEGLPSLPTLPWITCKLARMGVSLETVTELVEEFVVEWLTDQSPQLVYARRKALQFKVETECALALIRQYRAGAVLLRFPSLSPLFTEYWRYAKPSEFGPLPPDVDAALATGLSRVIPDAYGLLDEFIGKLEPFRQDRAILVIVANHGERSSGRGRANQVMISPDSLLEKVGWSDRVLWDTSESAVSLRAPDQLNNENALEDLEVILRDAQREPEDDENSMNVIRRLFSVVRHPDRIDLSLVNPQSLTGDMLVTIGDWSGPVSEILMVGEPPSGMMAGTGLLIVSGPQFRAGVSINGAYVYDVVPTILQAMGIELNTDLQGRPLEEIFRANWYSEHPPQFVDSYEPPEPPPPEEAVEPSVVPIEELIDPRLMGPPPPPGSSALTYEELPVAEFPPV